MSDNKEENELGQGHTSEVRPADKTITSTAPRYIADELFLKNLTDKDRND